MAAAAAADEIDPNTELDPTERQIQLNQRLLAATQNALLLSEQLQPKNTKKSYANKQKEFIDWCARSGFDDGSAVTSSKLLLFIQDEVATRELRGSRYKKDRLKEDGEEVTQTLAAGSVESYVSAILRLWKVQYDRRPQDSPMQPPMRSQALKDFLKARLAQEAARRREEFVDRAAGTLMDGYTIDELVRVVRFCWEGWQPGSEGPAKSGRKRKRSTTVTPESYLRTAVDVLLSHSMLLRGEDRRNAELPDLFALEMENEGVTPCWAMLLIMDNGKTNKFGKVQYGTALRHRNPLLCTLSHLAFYFFYRWNVAREPHPTFKRRQDWYRIHALKGADRTNPLSYETQLSWTNDVFDAVQVTSLKKTHSGRIKGAQHAELAGTPESQIQRGGRWNHDAMTGCYLSRIPRKFVRSMAGFHPSGQGDYFIPRAMVEPPKSVVRLVWPWVDEALAWFDSNEPAGGGDDDDSDLDADECDLAGKGFLRLLVQLRIILLQDSVFFRNEFPEHPLWNHPVFRNRDYLSFARELELSVAQNVEEPQDVLVRRALPLLAERLTAFEQSLNQTTKQWGQKAYSEVRQLRATVQDVLTGRIPVRFQAPLPPLSSSSSGVASAAPSESPKSSTPASGPDTTTTTPYATPAASPGAADPDPAPAPAPTVSLPVPRRLAAASSGGPTILLQQLPPKAATSPSSEPPYRMSRTIRTVDDLWREWTVGLGANQSIQSLEDSYGAKWRPEQKERTFFSRRKVIIDYIRARASVGANPQAVIQELELRRSAAGWSLAKLSNVLNSNPSRAGPVS